MVPNHVVPAFLNIHIWKQDIIHSVHDHLLGDKNPLVDKSAISLLVEL